MKKEGSVIGEIQKRPFIRPLFFWIIGILLQVCFPLQQISFFLLMMITVAVLLSFFLSPKNETLWFHNRWVWGVIIALILIFLSIQVTGLVEQRLRTPQEPGFLLRYALDIQSQMVAKLGLLHLPDVDKSVLATLTLNYRKAMDWGIFKQFSVSGVAHLLSVSGFHVAIVCAFVHFLLSFISDKSVVLRWTKYLITLFCVWSFAFLSGLATAAVRAAVMLTIYLTGRGVLGRKADSYNTLAGAAFCMLVYNPFYLFDIGFQLSYVAVFFILYLQPRLNRLIEVRNPLIANPWGVLTVTIAAQIGTCFLSFYYFGFSSMVFLFTNLALSLIATLLIPVTLIWMITPDVVPGMDFLRLIVETLTRCMMWIVDRFSVIPGATIALRFDFFTLLSSYLCLSFVLIYFRTRRYWVLIASLVTLLLILCWQLFIR